MHLLVPEINCYIDQFLVEPYNAAVHGAVTDFVTAINPWGAILKPDGEIRPLMDPTITGYTPPWLIGLWCYRSPKTHCVRSVRVTSSARETLGTGSIT